MRRLLRERWPLAKQAHATAALSTHVEQLVAMLRTIAAQNNTEGVAP